MPLRYCLVGWFQSNYSDVPKPPSRYAGIAGETQDRKAEKSSGLTCPLRLVGLHLGFDPELFDLAIKCGETQPHELGSVRFVAAGLV